MTCDACRGDGEIKTANASGDSDWTICAKCKGEMKVGCNPADYGAWLCRSCVGLGFLYQPVPVLCWRRRTGADAIFDARYLNLLSTLPVCLLHVSRTPRIGCRFTFNGGDGLLMPMDPRDTKPNHILIGGRIVSTVDLSAEVKTKET